MLVSLLGIPIFTLLLMLQLAIVSRLPLLQGTADLLMLFVIGWALHERVKHAWQWALIGGIMVSLVSATPFFAPLAAYLITTGIGRLLQRQVWQTPILAMLLLTVLGTLIYHGITFVALFFNGTTLPVQESISLVTLPSTLLNLIFALPIFVIVNDLAHWVYPVEVI